MTGSDPSSRLAGACPPLSLRPERESDTPFLQALYGSTRVDELARVDWSEAQAGRFVAQQFRAQRAHYRQHYPGAEFLVVECDGVPIGRLYLHLTHRELRLMDIILHPDWRERGLGRSLLLCVLDRALDADVPITLHVEPFNPARLWYERLGFGLVEERGVYWFMQLPVERMTAAREKLRRRA